MSSIFIPGTAGDFQTVAHGSASGGIIIHSDKILVIDPGIGFMVRSQLSKADMILLSSRDLLYSNDANAIRECFNASIIEHDSEEIKHVQNSYRIMTHKYVLGYITHLKLTRSIAEEFKDSNILVIRCESVTVEDMVNLIEYVNPELAILTGFVKGVDGMEFTRELKKELQKYKERLKTQIIAAKDQMRINPDSYNIKIKQKSLKGFLG